MTPHRVVRRLSATVLIAMLTTAAPPAAARSVGTRYLVFIDLSSSAVAGDRERWASFVDDHLIRRLRPGDALTIYPIHARTLEAAAIFNRVAPTLPANRGNDQLTLAARALNDMRTSARAALEKALAGSVGSSQTDVLSALDRYQPDVSGRRMVVLFMSDMLHAAPDLNLERTSITVGNLHGVLKTLAQQRQWRSDQLAGAQVFCMLNAESPGQSQAPTNRRVLRQFYEALFEALGARLIRFDTDIDAAQLAEGQP